MIESLMKAYTFSDLEERLFKVEWMGKGTGCECDDLLRAVAESDGYFVRPSNAWLLKCPPSQAIAHALKELGPQLDRLFGPNRICFDPVLSHPHANRIAIAAFVDRLCFAFEDPTP